MLTKALVWVFLPASAYSDLLQELHMLSDMATNLADQYPNYNALADAAATLQGITLLSKWKNAQQPAYAFLKTNFGYIF